MLKMLKNMLYASQTVTKDILSSSDYFILFIQSH